MLVLSDYAARKPKFFFWLSGLVSMLFVLLVMAGSLAPATFPFLHPLKIDTDPENMLSPHEEVRVFHNEMKKEFALYDMIVVGAVNKKNENGVFNVASLKNIHELTDYAKTLRWEEDGKKHGVISVDLLAPSTVDNIEQAGLGTVRFEWLMKQPPKTEEEARAVAQKAKKIPFLKGTVLSDDEKAVMLYVPLQQKSDSYDVAQKLREKIKTFDNGDEYYITGLPIAQDQFGVEMFWQMAVSAPLAMALIFALMWYFFRHLRLIVAPMIVALMSVIVTMGLLVVTGNTVHIMSSMIPIFIMPIAVLDAVHILSDFFDLYPKIKDRKKTLAHVMDELGSPMLFTTLTTCAGFGSLVFTPIPPVQIFGLFIALGVFAAWFLTVTLIPAYVMLMPEESLKGFGMTDPEDSSLARFMHWVGDISFRRAGSVLLVTVLLGGSAAYGISKIVINDNPVKWFEKNHEIRIADKALNERFAGTYMAYLALDATDEDAFKQPEMLRYIESLQDYLLTTGLVGKSNALPDVVKTVYRELLEGNPSYFRIPDSAAGIAQTLMTYESSHRPNDLWHFVTPDYKKATLWIQMKSGDNKDMTNLVAMVDGFIKNTPPPVEIKHNWFGLTYINVVWQDKMVNGMLESFGSSFVIVLLMMVFLFRSVLWGALSMIPLTVTIGVIYGAVGLIGKDYDMPIAVLSALSLGLAVDYAIHFLARSRELYAKYGSWEKAIPSVFGEPGRAIFRNVIIIGVGFLPLLAAPLIPYKTVGAFISAILLLAGVASLFILPALIKYGAKFLFPKNGDQS
ncbi:MAG: RND family transporter [Bdellovibrionales bacterium]